MIDSRSKWVSGKETLCSYALYQSVVLIMQDADLKPGKVNKEQHKYWRYVSPVRSYLDWLPEKIAFTFCSTALEVFAGRQYGELKHLEEMENPRFASMTFQNIYHIGDTKSGQELAVFLTMPLERLRLGCGIQCTEAMLPLVLPRAPFSNYKMSMCWPLSVLFGPQGREDWSPHWRSVWCRQNSISCSALGWSPGFRSEP